MQRNKLKIEVQSEIGWLNAVLLHRPGAEVENMTPRNVQRALYSDILNLSIARNEYEQLSGVLSKLAAVYEVRDLLVKVLDQWKPRADLVHRICVSEDVVPYIDTLMEMDSPELARVLIEGLPARVDSLTAYLRNEYYALYPLYNFYFTRDAAVTIGNQALICRMANKVRMRESLIMDAIYRYSGAFECGVVDANEEQPETSQIIMEGGDILIAREDILIVGNGVRTTPQGIDFIVDRFCKSCPSGKSIEGTAAFMGSMVSRMFKKNIITKIGALCCSSGIKSLKKLLDYREIGGTQFLGIKKPVIKAHGSSDALAFRNAVKQAMDAAKSDISQELEQGLAALNPKEPAND